jgi:glyoxylate reductase
MEKSHVLLTEPIDTQVMDFLREHVVLDVAERGTLNTEDALIQRIASADAVLSMLSNPITENVLSSSKKLKVVANYAVGYNNIDVAAASRLGIKVTNTPHVLTEATADIALSLLLAVCRQINPAEQFLRDGNFDGWHPGGFVGIELSGKKALIVGMGRIGKAIARRLNGFGIQVSYHNRNRIDPADEKSLDTNYVPDLESVLHEVDFLFLSCPLTPETHHLFDKRKLEMLPERCVIINTGRGPVIHEEALAEALINQKIAGAGLDVFEFEPKIVTKLLEAPNTVLLPHIGSATRETRHKMGMLAANSILHILNGAPDSEIPNLVTFLS